VPEVPPARLAPVTGRAERTQVRGRPATPHRAHPRTRPGGPARRPARGPCRCPAST